MKKRFPRAIERLALVWPPMLATNGSVALQSRNALDLSARFPSVSAVLEAFSNDDIVLDGELVGRKGTRAFHSLQIGSAHVDFAVFDVLWARGKDLRHLPLSERRMVLEEILSKAPAHVHIAERFSSSLDRALAQAKKRELEGVVCKRSDSRYLAGRRPEWRKLKLNTTDEFTIVGFLPHSTTAGLIGALLIAQRGRFAGKVGTGFSNATRAQLFDLLSARIVSTAPVKDAPRITKAVWARPELVCEIEYSEFTPDFRLRHPVFKRLREDKAT
jgi:bifunctional non-homologous end joining protein LigD